MRRRMTKFLKPRKMNSSYWVWWDDCLEHGILLSFKFKYSHAHAGYDQTNTRMKCLVEAEAPPDKNTYDESSRSQWFHISRLNQSKSPAPETKENRPQSKTVLSSDGHNREMRRANNMLDICPSEWANKKGENNLSSVRRGWIKWSIETKIENPHRD